MDTLRIACQLVIALGIFNVWLLRFGKTTPYRGGDARNMCEEFAAYGLPRWFMYVIGGAKLGLAVVLILAIWSPSLRIPAALAMAVLMLGAIVMHVKVKDPPLRAMPASLMLVLSLIVATM